MPYRNAHWWILALFPLIGLAFWPNYLSVISTSPPSFHFHGITASLWLILLITQSWSIQHGHRAFHRTNGLVSLALFPLFLAGGAGIFIGMAQRYAAEASPFSAIWPPHLAWLDFVSVFGMAWFYFQALRHRRDVGKHSGYLLATVIFLLPPVLGRLAPIPMGLDFSQPDVFEKLGPGFHAGQILSALIAFVVAASDRRRGKPFAIAGVLTVLGSILFEYPGGSEAWQSLYRNVALIPTLPVTLVAAIGGAAVGWAGWVAGKRPREPDAQALPA